MTSPAPVSTPPRASRRYRIPFEVTGGGARPLRRQSFWAGLGGTVITGLVGALVVALLVGWVLLWADRPGSASIPMLVLGCVAFTTVLAIIASLHNRLQAHWKLRQVEAAFLSGISHNLRTPISGIRAAAQALQQPALADGQREALIQAIIGETRRLGLRVDNVLETGRIEVERRLSGTDIDLGRLVAHCAGVVAPVAEGRGGRVDLELDDGVVITGDERALRLLIDNLLDNAVCYSDGPPDVRVELGERDGFALLRVRDRGIGFDEATAARLFRHYWRGDTGRQGTGLGLPLARSIARGHGGELHLHSDGPGHGAVAEAWLPLADGQRGRDGAERR